MRLLTPRIVLILWTLTLIVLAITVLAKPGKLYRSFVNAGDNFLHAKEIYLRIIPPTEENKPPTYEFNVPDGQEQFRYSPLVAALTVPWVLLPEPVGAVLWRFLQAAVLLLALRAWARLTVPEVPWPALALFTLPLAAGNFHNAQVNPLATALMLGAVVAFSRDRLWLAAFAITAASLFKLYPISLGLLLCVVEPKRFTPRLLIAVAVGVFLPFALQSPSYVREQYDAWFFLLNIDDRSFQPMHEGYHDFQKLLLRWGLSISLETYRGSEVLAGCAAAAFICWGRLRGWDRIQLLYACTALGLVWCTLFGPSTESATYITLAPIAAQTFLAVTGRPLWERLCVRLAYVLLISAQAIQWFPHPISDPFRGFLIPQAHGALLILIWLVWQMSGWQRTR